MRHDIPSLPVDSRLRRLLESGALSRAGREVYDDCRAKNERLASIVLVLGWTGLRWGEARAMTVSDVVQVPTSGLMVRRSRSEGASR